MKVVGHKRKVDRSRSDTL